MRLSGAASCGAAGAAISNTARYCTMYSESFPYIKPGVEEMHIERPRPLVQLGAHLPQLGHLLEDANDGDAIEERVGDAVGAKYHAVPVPAFF